MQNHPKHVQIRKVPLPLNCANAVLSLVQLKGQSHEIFDGVFFLSHEAAPPGPIRNVLGPILFFSLFD